LKDERNNKTGMKDRMRRGIRKIRLILSWLRSWLFGFFYRKEFRGISNFCLFVGYWRSGHSLVASLLDAHAEICFGMEWGVLPHVKTGYTKNQIYYSLIRNSYLFRKREHNKWTGYSYRLENSWQGRFKRLRVIGDKQGGRTAMMLRKDPNLLKTLEKIIGRKPLFIHVIRNPFDVIATHAIRLYGGKSLPRRSQIMLVSDLFFERAELVQKLKNDGRHKIFDIYHEEFVDHPEEILKQAVYFLGLEAEESYLNDCSSIVYDTPHKSRKKIEWTAEMINDIEKRSAPYPFLSHYRFIGA